MMKGASYASSAGYKSMDCMEIHICPTIDSGVMGRCVVKSRSAARDYDGSFLCVPGCI